MLLRCRPSDPSMPLMLLLVRRPPLAGWRRKTTTSGDAVPPNVAPAMDSNLFFPATGYLTRSELEQYLLSLGGFDASGDCAEGYHYATVFPSQDPYGKTPARCLDAWIYLQENPDHHPSS
jgi:hypothetical protein